MNAWNIGKERKSGELNRITASGAKRFGIVVDVADSPVVTTSLDGGNSFSGAISATSTLTVGDKKLVFFKLDGAMGPLVKVTGSNWSILQED